MFTMLDINTTSNTAYTSNDLFSKTILLLCESFMKYN